MDVLSLVEKQKIIAIVRGLDDKYMLDLAEALYLGGIDIMEVTFNQKSPDTWQKTVSAISAVSKNLPHITVGAGTVITKEQLNMAYSAGAKFIVSPNTDPEIIKETKKLGLYSFPGALTPTEAVIAHNAGADAVKIFPIGDLGDSYLKAIKAPLSHIKLIAVGGVNEINAPQFLKAGAIGLGVGGNLVNKQWIENGEYNKITLLAQKYRQAVDNIN